MRDRLHPRKTLIGIALLFSAIFLWSSAPTVFSQERFQLATTQQLDDATVTTPPIETDNEYPDTLNRTIRGNVYYDYGRVRIAARGVRVGLHRGTTIEAPLVSSVTTDTNGFYQFSNLQRETFMVWAVAPGFIPSGRIVDLTRSSGQIVNFFLTPDRNNATPSLVVKVVHQATALAGASVSVYWTNEAGNEENHEEETNGDGKAFFIPVDPDKRLQTPAQVRVKVSHPGFREREINVTVTDSLQEVAVALEPEAPNDRVVQVVFLDRSTRRPVLGVSGELNNETGGRQTFSAPYGRVTLILATATTLLSARADAYDPVDNVVVGRHRRQTIYMTRSACRTIQRVLFCFAGPQAEQIRDNNDPILNTIAGQVVRIRSSARLPEGVPEFVLISDDFGENAGWVDPVLEFGSELLTGTFRQWVAIITDHEMGHAVFAKSPHFSSDQLTAFSRSYSDETGDTKIFEEETEGHYGIDEAGHPDDWETEAFASLTALIAQLHPDLHFHMVSHLNENQRRILQVKHDIVHQVTGL